MQAYKRGGHTVWDSKYHLVWVTKYRESVLGGVVWVRCRELLREMAQTHEMVVHAGPINREPCQHAAVDPAKLVVARAVQPLKGRSSHKLLSEVGPLRKRYWGQHLWARICDGSQA
jgi:putative transposase